MAVKIRPIALKDAAGYRRCWDAIARERRYLFEHEAPSLSHIRGNLRRNQRLKNPFLVAVDGERIVGLAFIWPGGWPSLSHTGDLGIRILPEYREMGLGTKLMAAVLKMARGKLDSVIATVLWKNKRARNLFEKMGFKTRVRTKKFAKMAYGFDDVLVMQKQMRR